MFIQYTVVLLCSEMDASSQTTYIPRGALGPNMCGCVPLRCCDFYPVWEHFPQFRYPRLGAKWPKNHTLFGSKGSRKYTVVLSGSKNLKRVYPFGSIFAENDTRLGSKNGENYTLSSGTYPVPKTSMCPPPPGYIRPAYWIVFVI